MDQKNNSSKNLSQIVESIFDTELDVTENETVNQQIDVKLDQNTVDIINNNNQVSNFDSSVYTEGEIKDEKEKLIEQLYKHFKEMNVEGIDIKEIMSELFENVDKNKSKDDQAQEMIMKFVDKIKTKIIIPTNIQSEHLVNVEQSINNSKEESDLLHIIKLDNCKPCGKKFNNDMKTCGKCLTIKYCSKECQVKDWSEHKVICKLIFHMKTTMIRSDLILPKRDIQMRDPGFGCIMVINNSDLFLSQMEKGIYDFTPNVLTMIGSKTEKDFIHILFTSNISEEVKNSIIKFIEESKFKLLKCVFTAFIFNKEKFGRILVNQATTNLKMNKNDENQIGYFKYMLQ